MAAALLRGLDTAFIIGVDPVGGIGKPDGAVGPLHEIIRGIESVAIVPAGKNRDAPVMLGPGRASRPMFARDQPPLTIDAVAVGEVGRGPEDRNRIVSLVPPHQAIVWNVGPQEVSPCREPCRALRPARAGPQSLESNVPGAQSDEAH